MWIYGNRRSECAALLLGAVLFLAASQGLESIGSAWAAFARWAMIGLAAACSAAGLWFYAHGRR